MTPITPPRSPFPKLDRAIWILMLGRLLSQIGTGFVLFYAPIFFVNQVGLSATLVGVGLGAEAVLGVVGRILSGLFADSASMGRRKTLLLAAAVSALADGVLAISRDFPVFLAGSLLMGLGIGLYWPAMEAAVADLTNRAQRNEAYALTRLADSIGLGLGVVVGGWLINSTGAYRSLFVLDGISFVVFFGIVYLAIPETRQSTDSPYPLRQGWHRAVRDRPLVTFVLANLLFTTYLALINSALPLYLTNYVPIGEQPGFDTRLISVCFTWYIGLTSLCQLPVARWLNRISRARALMLSAVLWSIGFGLIWLTGITGLNPFVFALLGLSGMALATTVYNPSASSLVAELSPDSLRGIYASINALCWAGGYFIGPTIGGWAMDQPRSIAHGFWLVAATSVLLVLSILQLLSHQLRSQPVDKL